MRPLLLLSLLAAPALATAAPLYTLEKTIKIGAPDKWDYLTFDDAGKRVLIAHGTETTIVDPQSGKIIGQLSPLAGAHGQVVAPDGRIFADSGQTGTVTVFDGKTFKPGKTVKAEADADGMTYDAANKAVVVADGDPSKLTLINTTTLAPIAVTLPGSPESIAADTHGALFVNLADVGKLARVEGTKVAASWVLPDCESPHGIAVDPETDLVFPACKNAKLLVVDGKTGAIKNTFPIGRGNDAGAFDTVRKRAFASNGDGTIAVFQVQGGTVTKLGDVATAPGARTMAVDSATGRLFTVTGDVAGKEAAGKGGSPHWAFKPGSLKLMVFKPVS